MTSRPRSLTNAISLPLPPLPPQPFKLGEKLGDPASMYLQDVFTVPVSLAGLPRAESSPVATVAGSSGSDSAAGALPVGLQLIGPHFSEALLLRTADALKHEERFKAPVPEMSDPAS